MSTRDMKSGVECMLLEKMRMSCRVERLSESCLSRVTSPKGGPPGRAGSIRVGKIKKNNGGKYSPTIPGLVLALRRCIRLP